MRNPNWLFLSLVLLSVAPCIGCARAARDTQGFALTDTATVNASFNDTWQMVKAVLREEDYDLYTRDKRGVFVAFTGGKRKYPLGGHRTKYTISLETISDSATKVTVETIRQVYGVTLLTYPGWHDRKAKDNAGAQAILKALEAKVAGASATAGSGQTATAEPVPATS